MTDLSRFSDQNFDAIKWINTIISEVPDGENLDSHLTSISMKLHMVTQDYSEQLETAMIESMTSMPRMIGEIARLEDQLRSVQKEMENIENNVRLADKRGLTGLEDLSRLDHLKSNMDKCKSTLEEYDRWNQVVREARQLLESGGVLSETADRISLMFHSLEVLKNLPGHEDRQENCHKFRTTLLDALRPNIEKELTTMNIAALQEYSYVFGKLGSDDEFKQLYTTQRPAHLLKLWSEIKQGESFSEWIALYLGTVGRFLQEEEEYITELFGVTQLSTFCRSMLLQTLEPLDKRLISQLSVYNDVNTIFECYLVLEEFGRRNILTLEHSDISERWTLMDAVFSGVWKFLPNYIEIEERSLRRVLYQAMDTISLASIVQEYQEQTGLVGMEDIDPMEVMSLYSDRLVDAVQSVLNETLQFLDRVAKIFGGISLKTALRSTANLLQTLLRLLALKVGNIALALGISDFSQGIVTAGGGMFEPYSSYLDENSFAQSLSERIFASEISRQGVMAAALHAFKIIAQAFLSTNAVEQRIRVLSGQVMQQVQWQQSMDWNASTAIHQLVQNHSSDTSQQHRLGVWFGQWKLQRDMDSGSELRSFLATCPTASSSTTNSTGNTLLYQGILSATQLLLQRLELKTKEMMLTIGIRQPEKLVTQYLTEDCWQRVVPTLAADTFLDIQSQLLPLSIVTQVGEHLLSLVQDLESFSSQLESMAEQDTSSDVLGVSVTETLHTKQRVATTLLTIANDSANSNLNGLFASSASVAQMVEQCVSLVSTSTGWRLLKDQLLIADTKALRQISDRGQVSKLLTVFDKEAAALGIRSWSQGDEDATANSSNDTAQASSVISYGEGGGLVNEWLMLFSDALIGLLLAQILHLPKPVSLYGMAQLVTDIDYFYNVIQATGIKPHPLFRHLKKIYIWGVQHPQESEKLLLGVSQGKSASILRDLIKLYSAVLQVSVANMSV